MTYDLYIGDRSFSSWSLRGWLMMENFNLPHRVHMVGLYSGTMTDDLTPLHPARLVPVMQRPDGVIVGETLAMAETLAEENPKAQMWPENSGARGTARWLCAEMAAGFSALRAACPMQLLHVVQGFQPNAAVRADLTRIETLWAHAAKFKTDGKWLFGQYSLADVFFAPVCARIIGYGLPVRPSTKAYALQTLRDAAFIKWRAEGLTVLHEPVPYDLGLPTSDWPN